MRLSELFPWVTVLAAGPMSVAVPHAEAAKDARIAELRKRIEKRWEITLSRTPPGP